MIWEQTINNVVGGLVTIHIMDKSMDLMDMGKKKRKKQKSKGLIPKKMKY